MPLADPVTLLVPGLVPRIRPPDATEKAYELFRATEQDENCKLAPTPVADIPIPLPAARLPCTTIVAPFDWKPTALK